MQGNEGRRRLNDGLDIHALASTTRALFHGARTQAPASFQDWALERLKSLVPFDACKWASGTLNGDTTYVHSIHLHNLPDNDTDDYLDRIKPQDPLLEGAMANLGKTVDLYDLVPREAFIASEVYKTYVQPLDIEHAVATLAYNSELGMYAMVSLFRRDYGTPFTSREKTAINALFPVLLDARNLNTFMHIDMPISGTDGARAICDRTGLLHEAEAGFAGAIQREWPDWHGPQLPGELISLMGDAQVDHFTGKCMAIDLAFSEELVQLNVRERMAPDALTQAEREVSRLLAGGLTNKEIAKALGISPKTVGNHLHHIFAKLDVPNRQRAIAMLKGET